MQPRTTYCRIQTFDFYSCTSANVVPTPIDLLGSVMEPFNKRKREWLDLLLQHAVPETLARSCIQDAVDDAQLIAKIKVAVPGEGVEQLVQVLSFPECDKRPWLNMCLLRGMAAKHAKSFVLGIKGGFPEIAAKLRRLIPAERVEAVVKEVRGARKSV